MTEVPDRYPFAEVVPEEGASCKTCKYMRGGVCHNKVYQAEMGTNLLGAEPDRWCCSVWTPPTGHDEGTFA